jgi:putative SbcD/Mre11-related phosphoesterase
LWQGSFQVILRAMNLLPIPNTTGLFATGYRFLWHAPTSTAILADLHLGVEVTLAKHGLYLPVANDRNIKESWERVAGSDGKSPKRVVIAGDLFDSRQPPESAVQTCRELLRKLREKGIAATITPGNHDPTAKEMAELLDEEVEIVPEVELEPGILVSHGHKLPSNFESQNPNCTWIVGHQHPVIMMSNRVQRAKMVCFGVCRVDTKRIVVLLPAFSRAPLGSDLRVARHWLLPLKRPADADIQILGIVEPAEKEPEALPFGFLSGLI